MNPLEGIFGKLKTLFAELLQEHGLANESVTVTARPLSPGEAIGNPEADDYPILKGKERMMEAVFRGAKGQAFTDMCGEWSGGIGDVLKMDLTNNFRRALFVASLNAALRHLGSIEHTIHCRNEGPERCAEKLLEALSLEHPDARITMIGYQPRMVEVLSKCFNLNVVDMDRDNIGRRVSGTTIYGPESTTQFIDDADLVLVTGTTLVNGTIEQFLGKKNNTIFYGITIAGAAKILDLRRFCPYGL